MASGDMKLVYKDRVYIIPQDVYNLLVQMIATDVLKHK